MRPNIFAFKLSLLLFLFIISPLSNYLGQEKTAFDKASEMDYGPSISMTVKAPWPNNNTTLKGITVPLRATVYPEKGFTIGQAKVLKMRSSEIKKYTDLPEVYHKQREGCKGYWIPLPEGKYSVTLQFAELKRSSLSERVFDITLQDRVVEENFETLANTNKQKFKAVDRTFNNISVSKYLKISFTQKSLRSPPSIAGIIIAGNNFSKKINCGGSQIEGYDADWDKNDYLHDPHMAGIIFDTEQMRYSAAWLYGLLDFNGAVYNEVHGTYPQINLSDNPDFQQFGTSNTTGWAPAAKYKGLFHCGRQVLFSYTLNGQLIYDHPGLVAIANNHVFTRDIETPSLKSNATQTLLTFKQSAEIVTVNSMPIAISQEGDTLLAVGLIGDHSNKTFNINNNNLTLTLKAGVAHRYQIGIWKGLKKDLPQFTDSLQKKREWVSLSSMSHGGEKNWPQTLHTQGQLAPSSERAFAVDKITLPDSNPWKSWMRPGALDFFKEGKRLAMSTWSGDVWIASGLDDKLNNITWNRYATGLFHPLGLKIIDEKIYVLGRDQITILHDNNNDGEADYYENFNNDMQITDNFHEFAFDLQTDKAGNFYFSKGAPVNAGGEGFGTNITPHHGCLFRLSKDGKNLKVIATGLRAPNGIGIGPNDEITSSDNEGGWTPSTPINWIKEGEFYGVMPTSHRKTVVKKRGNVLCFIPHNIDRSAGGQVWIPKGHWGALGGELLHLSYGNLKVFHVMKEEVSNTMQGGVLAFQPSGTFDSGIMRGHFNLTDNHLYLCGLKGWESNATKEGGLYRMRYTGKTITQPTGLRIGKNGLKISFPEPLDPATALDAGNIDITQWDYEVSENYGSDSYLPPSGKHWNHQARWSPLPDSELKKIAQIKDKEKQKEALHKLKQQHKGKKQNVAINSLSLSSDNKTLFIEIKNIRPVMQMEINFTLKTQDGKEIKHSIYNSIHHLGDWEGKPGTALTVSDNNKPQGLLLTLTQTNKKDYRISDFAALHVNKGEAPSTFLEAQDFSALFEGYIKSNKNLKVSFKIEGNGKQRLLINGQEVISNTTVPLKKGFNTLLINHIGPSQHNSTFRLYWKSSTFPWEPLPPTSLYHDSGHTALAQAQQLRQGRFLTLQNNCFNCHSDKNDNITLSSLTDAGKRFNTNWLSQSIINPQHMQTQSHMPRLLDALDPTTQRQVASDIASYLEGLGTNNTASQHSAEQSVIGKTLYAELGCASCHSSKDLSFVNAKYKAGALSAYLQSPRTFHLANKMPDFGLSKEEALSLAAHLREASKKSTIPSFPKGNPAKGKAYIIQYNCVACHTIPGLNNKKVAPPLFGKKTSQRGCLSENKALPQFSLSPEDNKAISAYLQQDSTSLTRVVAAEYAQHALNTLQCTSCHQQKGQASRWVSPHSVLNQQPPDITYIGEKLNFTSLANILNGTLSEKMRPWMKARMPSFKHSANQLSQGLMALQGFDAHAPSPHHKVSDAQIQQGKQLVASTSCVTCHDIDKEKAKAPFASPAPNLKYSANRLTQDYFIRWMHNPQRIQTTTGMPPYPYSKEQFDNIFYYLKSLSPQPKTKHPTITNKPAANSFLNLWVFVTIGLIALYLLHEILFNRIPPTQK